MYHKQQFVSSLPQEHSYKQLISELVDGCCRQQVRIAFPAISFIYAVFLCVVIVAGEWGAERHPVGES